jgi:branched-chain amino acid transport system permease protein
MKNYVSSQTDHWLFFIGVIFIVCVIFFPEGVWGSYLKSLESRRRVS